MITGSCGLNRNIKIVPNPVNEGEPWEIQGISDNDIISITDIHGRVWDTYDLPKGVYIIIINGKYHQRLVVQ